MLIGRILMVMVGLHFILLVVDEKRFEILKFLLENGGNVNIQTNDGNTPLIFSFNDE